MTALWAKLCTYCNTGTGNGWVGYFEGSILTTSVPKGRHEFLKYLLLSLRVPNWNCWITSLNSFTHSSLVSRDLAWEGRQFDFRQEIRCFLGNKILTHLACWQSWLFQHLKHTRTRPRVDNPNASLRQPYLDYSLVFWLWWFPCPNCKLARVFSHMFCNSQFWRLPKKFLGLISQVFRLFRKAPSSIAARVDNTFELKRSLKYNALPLRKTPAVEPTLTLLLYKYLILPSVSFVSLLKSKACSNRKIWRSFPFLLSCFGSKTVNESWKRKRPS